MDGSSELPGDAGGGIAPIEIAAAKLRVLLAGMRPGLAVVLGSGLAPTLDAWDERGALEFAECFPWLTQGGAPGHRRRWRVGKVAGSTVLALDGRLHLYEGYTAAQAVAPLAAVLELEPQLLLLTNAAGCLRAEWEPGELMVISDHVNLTGANPLRGPRPGGQRPAFLDMSDLYCPVWRARARRWAAGEGIVLREGVYAGVAGPTYETPAEVRALSAIGIDAVGMSTVIEAILARSHSCPTLGVSCLTNRAAGLGAERLDHADVLRRGQAAAAQLARLITWATSQLAGA